MPQQRQVRRSYTRVMSTVMIVIGIVILVRTIAAGGGPISARRAARRSVCGRGHRPSVPAVPRTMSGRPTSLRERPFSYRALFAVVYTTSVSSVYFALGVVAHRANGLTWAVFLAAGIFFQLTAMTYVEGASLHPERSGSPVFARYAFNELVSFVAAWALVLDYTILIAVTALTVPAYLAVFWGQIGHGALELVDRVRGDRLCGDRQPDRDRRGPRAPADPDHRRRPGAAGGRDRARAGARVPPPPPDPERQPVDRAEGLGSRVRADDRGDRVHRAWRPGPASAAR